MPYNIGDGFREEDRVLGDLVFASNSSFLPDKSINYVLTLINSQLVS